MDDILKKLADEGKNNIITFIQWLQDENIIDRNILSDLEAHRHIENGQDLDLTELRESLQCLTREHSDKVQLMVKNILECYKSMEAAFEKLKKDGKNTVDNLIQWLKDTSPKIIDGEKVTEEKARSLFQGVDSANVELSKFKEVVSKLATEHKSTAEDLMKNLGGVQGVLQNAAAAGMSALQGAFK